MNQLLPNDVLIQIAVAGWATVAEVRAMVLEILRRREEEKKSQPGPEGFPELPRSNQRQGVE